MIKLIMIFKEEKIFSNCTNGEFMQREWKRGREKEKEREREREREREGKGEGKGEKEIEKEKGKNCIKSDFTHIYTHQEFYKDGSLPCW